MTYQNQTQQARRQFRIIKRLYNLEELSASLVAEEYGVSSRTILRDMRKISSIISLVHSRGKWRLDTQVLHSNAGNRLDYTLLSSFAHNAQLAVSFLEKSNLSHEKVSFAIEYESLPRQLGEQIIQALIDDERCGFRYAKPDRNSRREVDPIRLYTESGKWYLIAKDWKDDIIKTFNLARIQMFKQLNLPTSLTSEMIKETEKIQSVWSSSSRDAWCVKLYIVPNVALHIRDTKLHKSQIIHDEHHDGGMEAHYTITHKLEILPAIKSWLPHIYILEPKWLQEELMGDLEVYHDENWKMDI